ncbi:unnamed protein product [Dicrocoelium dendriticum]|nr:unnamed protein product [Dicrocoelium dendriticum]
MTDGTRAPGDTARVVCAEPPTRRGGVLTGVARMPTVCRASGRADSDPSTPFHVPTDLKLPPFDTFRHRPAVSCRGCVADRADLRWLVHHGLRRLLRFCPPRPATSSDCVVDSLGQPSRGPVLTHFRRRTPPTPRSGGAARRPFASRWSTTTSPRSQGWQS